MGSSPVRRVADVDEGPHHCDRRRPSCFFPLFTRVFCCGVVLLFHAWSSTAVPLCVRAAPPALVMRVRALLLVALALSAALLAAASSQGALTETTEGSLAAVQHSNPSAAAAAAAAIKALRPVTAAAAALEPVVSLAELAAEAEAPKRKAAKKRAPAKKKKVRRGCEQQRATFVPRCMRGVLGDRSACQARRWRISAADSAVTLLCSACVRRDC